MSIYHVLWYFIIYAFIGWCLEVVFCSVSTGKFVNRGFLNGPYCPIYGFGALILVLILSPIAHFGILVLYLGSVLLCSLLELVGGWALKKIFHTSWWDYSDQPFNIGGYVCLKFSLLWGVAGVVAMRVIHPLVTDLVALIPTILGVILLLILYIVLLVDLGVTVAALHKLDRDLAEIERLAKGLHQGSDRLAKGIGNTAITVAARVESFDLEGKKQQITEFISEEREKLTTALEPDALREHLNMLSEKSTPVRNRLMRAFPKMSNVHHIDAFLKLRESFEKRQSDKHGKDDVSEGDTAELDQK